SPPTVRARKVRAQSSMARVTGHIQSNPPPRELEAYTTAPNLHRATRPNAEKCESPLVIRCKFGAVTNSKSLISAHGHTSSHRDNWLKLKELRRVPECRSESLRVGCTTFNPLVDGSISSRPTHSPQQ